MTTVLLMSLGARTHVLALVKAGDVSGHIIRQNPLSVSQYAEMGLLYLRLNAMMENHMIKKDVSLIVQGSLMSGFATTLEMLREVSLQIAPCPPLSES